ncbi:hypothetical protein MBRA_05150 [Mycobacterium branderi]|uniref:Uncharacterized protein n=1 Tax=Mycobacterium branderi TaxID=43348 RepID=A0ABM7KHJ9_9MYCO|nr:hypothetical protein MBRA_05150 [Mycobacterium branderi]
MRRLQIDINRRNRAGQTPTSYVGPTPVIGERVVVFEPEDGVCADAVVAAVNPNRCLVVLDVDWDSMRDDVLVRDVTTVTGHALRSVGPVSVPTGGTTKGVAVLVGNC